MKQYKYRVQYAVSIAPKGKGTHGHVHVHARDDDHARDEARTILKQKYPDSHLMIYRVSMVGGAK